MKVNFTQTFIIHLISVLNKTRKTIKRHLFTRSQIIIAFAASTMSLTRAVFGYLAGTLLIKSENKKMI